MDNNNKLDFETIKAVFEEISKNKPLEMPEFKCGKVFEKALFDSCSEVVIKDVPFATAIVDPTLFGMKVVLDETLPANVARIGNRFIQLTV